MSWWRRRRRGRELELDKELRFHFAEQVRDYVNSGMSDAEARRKAYLDFGGLDQIKEECRDVRSWKFMETLGRDLRFSLRILRKSPSFTVVALVTLALAIGANAVVFGLMNGIMLRPLNVPEADSLYSIEYANEPIGTQSYPDYLDLRDRNRSFDGLAAFNISQAGLDTLPKSHERQCSCLFFNRHRPSHPSWCARIVIRSKSPQRCGPNCESWIRGCLF